MAEGRVLSEQMRPRCLEDVVGQDAQVASLNKQFSSGRVPHFFIFSGASGSGKTTMAKIVAHKMLSFAEVREINASDKNGIDDVRNIIESMRYQPMPPYKAKVVLFDEAHQLTSPAQNALLTATEDAPKYAYYMFCTTAKHKILPALQRRAYIINTRPLPENAVRDLLERAKHVSRNVDLDIEPLHRSLVENNVTEAGLVLQAAERFFGGLSARDASLSSTETEAGTSATKFDVMGIARAVSQGNWKSCSALLKQSDMNRSDVISVKACVLGYMKKVLLGAAPGTKTIASAKAINYIAQITTDDVTSTVSLIASLALACETMASASR